MGKNKSLTKLFYVSPERSRLVRQDIADGSEPGLRFYIMVVVSTMIAGFGLVTNSTAVIIGAMLVAPLMTPIFGLSLALVRNDARLFGHALQAEVVGVLAAIGMGYSLGSIYPGLEPTPEMLSRTNPQLFDLLVALFSGFAGAYALVDEKISPALPGVAIATAIVPPLANTGLCFSVGAWSGGIGSFLLFFSNFLSILLVGAIVFTAFKLTTEGGKLNTKTIVKRFGLPIISFLVIAIFLSQSLYGIWLEQSRKDTIQNTLIEELRKLPSIDYNRSEYHEEDGKIYVVADVYSDRIVNPHIVNRLQEQLEEELNKDTQLTIRASHVQTVSALDNRTQIVNMNLDGSFISEAPNKLVLQTKQADTIVRNYLADLPGSQLKYVRIVKGQEHVAVIVSLESLFEPQPIEIQEVEALLEKELGEKDIRLIVRFQKPQLYDRNGLYKLEISGLTDTKQEHSSLFKEIELFVNAWFTNIPGTSITNISSGFVDGEFHSLIELSTIKVFSVEEVRRIEKALKDETGKIVVLHVLSRPEVISSSQGYEPYDAYSKRIFQVMYPTVRAKLEQIGLE